jgi:[ribosomal protein S5]-alanine N-acetyltransferase
VSVWPVKIRQEELVLRPLRFKDKKVWDEVRSVNREWLSPWEATRPTIDTSVPLPNFYQMVLQQKRQGRNIETFALAIWIRSNGKEIFVGQITLGGIVFGAMRGAYIGYWIDQRFANRGYITRAVKILTQYGFEKLSLHRIEISMRPENEASKKVAEKAGYKFEGLRTAYLHIDGAWRDHLCFVKENPLIQ